MSKTEGSIPRGGIAAVGQGDMKNAGWFSLADLSTFELRGFPRLSRDVLELGCPPEELRQVAAYAVLRLAGRMQECGRQKPEADDPDPDQAWRNLYLEQLRAVLEFCKIVGISIPDQAILKRMIEDTEALTCGAKPSVFTNPPIDRPRGGRPVYTSHQLRRRAYLAAMVEWRAANKMDVDGAESCLRIAEALAPHLLPAAFGVRNEPDPEKMVYHDTKGRLSREGVRRIWEAVTKDPEQKRVADEALSFCALAAQVEMPPLETLEDVLHRASSGESALRDAVLRVLLRNITDGASEADAREAKHAALRAALGGAG